MLIVHGVVDANGDIVSGDGFEVSKTGTGSYEIAFDRAFLNEVPAVTATITPITGTNYNLRDNAHAANVLQGQVTIRTGDSNGNLSDRPFSFIAIGE